MVAVDLAVGRRDMLDTRKAQARGERFALRERLFGAVMVVLFAQTKYVLTPTFRITCGRIHVFK